MGRPFLPNKLPGPWNWIHFPFFTCGGEKYNLRSSVRWGIHYHNHNHGWIMFQTQNKKSKNLAKSKKRKIVFPTKKKKKRKVIRKEKPIDVIHPTSHHISSLPYFSLLYSLTSIIFPFWSHLHEEKMCPHFTAMLLIYFIAWIWAFPRYPPISLYSLSPVHIWYESTQIVPDRKSIL